jgi:hypothetical protein
VLLKFYLIEYHCNTIEPIGKLHNDMCRHYCQTAQRLATFVQAKRKQWAAQGEMTDVPAFERFEQELHTLVMALESELVGEELSRYDVTVQEIEVAGKAYRRGVRLPESYLTAAGCVTVERYLYEPVAAKGKSISPLELRSGIVAGYFTPRAARQGVRPALASRQSRRSRRR